MVEVWCGKGSRSRTIKHLREYSLSRQAFTPFRRERGFGFSPACNKMAKLRYGTHWITEDEPCLGLFEMNLQSPSSRGFHRYQIIYVMRGGEKPAEFRRDMGLAKKFKANQFRIPGGAYDERTDRYYVEHTVGELIEMANDMRNFPSFDLKELVLGTRKTIIR